MTAQGKIASAFDPAAARADFEILSKTIYGKPLVYLDNGASAQKPRQVLDAMRDFAASDYANVHRGVHYLSGKATDAYEASREKVRRYLNASSTREIIFVRGTTEGINLVAQSWGWRNIQKDDEIVITWLEHHANIVPWQMLCAEKGAKLRVAPVDNNGQVILEEYEKLLNPLTRLVSFSHVSNALGTVTPAREMIEMAHRHGAKVLLDGAQSVAHMGVDVQALDCDFYAATGHKLYGPTGIGVLYGRESLLESMPPFLGGGDMISSVTFGKSTWAELPHKFEAGTSAIAEGVGLGAVQEAEA